MQDALGDPAAVTFREVRKVNYSEMTANTLSGHESRSIAYASMGIIVNPAGCQHLP